MNLNQACFFGTMVQPEGISLKRTMRFQKRWFIVLAGFVVTLTAVFLMVYYISMERAILGAEDAAMLQAAQSVGTDLDGVIAWANTLSTQILYSDRFKQLFYSGIFSGSADSTARRQAFNAAFYSITGPQTPPFQINVMDKDGHVASFGLTPSTLALSTDALRAIPWLEACRSLDGAKLIAPTASNAILKAPSPVVSLSRCFGLSWFSPKDSVLEIQIPYDYIAKRILSHRMERGWRVQVFDGSGALIYPLAEEALPGVGDSGGWPYFMLSATNETWMAARVQSAPFGWTVGVYENGADYTRQARRFRNLLLLSATALLIAALFLSYRMSKRISRPIIQLRDSVSQLTLKTLPTAELTGAPSDLDEIQQLRLAYQAMIERLQTSLDETIAARNMEIQSRMLALQAQINPHFLYNTLTTISILAENDGCEKVCGAVDRLSGMLRYSNNTTGLPVTVEEEIGHTLDYIDLIRLRFDGDFLFNLDIPPAMRGILLPRLTLQPLIENCMKYACAGAPPWRVRMRGQSHPGGWIIRVEDNGPGFAPEQMNALKAAFAEARPLRSGRELEGIGLYNIRARLLFLHGDRTRFELGNLPEGGAFVEIGCDWEKPCSTEF